MLKTTLSNRCIEAYATCAILVYIINVYYKIKLLEFTVCFIDQF